MVQHRGRDGELHLYSSKPPLLATLLAGEYWLIHTTHRLDAGEHPYEVGRLMLLHVNVLAAVLMLVLAGAAGRSGLARPIGDACSSWPRRRSGRC